MTMKIPSPEDECLLFYRHFTESIYKNIRKFVDFEHMTFSGIMNEKDKIVAIDPESKKEKYLTLHQKSITNTAIDTELPVVVSYIQDSFIYDPAIDNPFDFPLDTLAVLPCISPDSGNVFGVVFLYKTKRRGSRDILNKNNIIKAEKFIKKRIATNQERLGKIIQFLPNRLDEQRGEIRESSELHLIKSNEFFSSIIHDIRTPMNAVMGFLELLEEEANPQQKEYVRAAHKSGEMVVALINDVLDYNKIATGKLDVDLHFFSPAEELENTALLFYHSALKKRIDFLTYFDPAIPYAIKSDPYRLKQVVNNLLSNAIKFTPDEGVVALELFYHPENDTLEVKVSDTGIGIAPDAQEAIFKPFQQAAKSTSGKFGGTGLGLSISKQLATLLGGDLSLESTPNVGSTFTLTLPCRSIPGTPSYLEVDTSSLPPIYLVEGSKSKSRYFNNYVRYFENFKIPFTATSAKSLLKQKNIPPNASIIGIKLDYQNPATEKLIKRYRSSLIILETQLFGNNGQLPEEVVVLDMPVFPTKLFNAIDNLHHKKESEKDFKKLTTEKNVLLVDDSVINLKLMREVSSRLGATPYTASDGKDAIEVFKQHPIDLILIDKNMPIVSGTEAIRQIRKLSKGKTIPIYGLTGDSDDETLKEMLDAGANAILTKPIQIDKLRQILTS